MESPHLQSKVKIVDTKKKKKKQKKQKKFQHAVSTKKSFRKPGYYTYPARKSSLHRQKSVAKYANPHQMEAVYQLAKGKRNLVGLPYYLIQYSLQNGLDKFRRNPTIRYCIERAILEGENVLLTDTGLTMEQYLRLPVFEIEREEREKKENGDSPIILIPPSKEVWDNKELDKYGVPPELFRKLPANEYVVEPGAPVQRYSEAAEVSIESSSELYNQYLGEVFSKHFATWNQLEHFLQTEHPEFYGNEYFLHRLMLEVYLRRVMAARIAAETGTGRSRRSPDASVNNIWSGFSDSIRTVYGSDQLKVFKEQT
ncbi:DEKNAAC104620 [Brettanomyces naardenensis]|uniref:DEKNAAC104620 n=1 Tax=Brettanomyces naardenensis TaxID=13370 RepID=A0A448YRQ9_BRENA|nr:DEKNAAC104620 [Brettanomyces naardenensis]